MKSVNIDIVSDVMCPWCYIGQKRMDKALEGLDDVDVKVSWRPFQLDPTLPPEGRDRREYLEKKFGGPERAKAIYQNIENAGLDEGIQFNFSAIGVSPNTLDAHRVIRWAGSAGDGIQEKLVTRLFEMFFLEGRNIGKHDVLIEAARDAGMDVSIVETLLPTDSDKEAVQNEIATAQQMGVTGVPCFIVDNKYAVVGAQEPEAIQNVIRQVADAKAEAAE
ncbi:MAG: DsbA family oxidoreductase [Pseudomonadota bacterium]